MFIRKYWIPLSVFIVAIVGVSLYVLQTRPPKEPVLNVTPVEYEKSPAKAPVVEKPEPVGHGHADGTFHAEAHEPVDPQPIANKVSPGGHWSDAYLPSDIEAAYADDPEALELAKAARLIRKYKDSLPPWEYSQKAEFLAAIQIKDDFYLDIAAGRFSPERHLELLKLLWPVLDTPPSDLW